MCLVFNLTQKYLPSSFRCFTIVIYNFSSAPIHHIYITNGNDAINVPLYYIVEARQMSGSYGRLAANQAIKGRFTTWDDLMHGQGQR